MKSRYETRQNRRSVKSKSFNLWSTFTLILIFSLLTYTAWIYKAVYKNTIYNGISLNGISLGGLTKQQAVEKVRLNHQSRLSGSTVKLLYEDNSWDVSAADINAVYDVEKKVDKAYQLGRQGNIINRYLIINDIAKNGHAIELDIVYNSLRLKAILDNIAKDINVEVKDAEIKFQTEKKQKIIVIPEQEGKTLDENQVTDQIIQRFRTGKSGMIPLKVTPIIPKVLSKDLGKLTNKIASFTTNLGNSTEDRKHNVFLAAKAFSGMRVKPGEIFSFNKTTGERTIERGYRDAPVITKDKSLEDGPGGGVCQASTTLYNTVLLAGLEVITRAHHSFPPFYVKPGLDATVNYPTTDFCFRNNRDTPVFIVSYQANNNLVVEVYGEMLDKGITYQLVNEVYEEIPAPKPEIREDINKEFADKVHYKDEQYDWVQSRKGIKVKTYRISIKDGEVLKKELVADDFYKPIKGITYIGTEERDLGSLLVPQEEEKTNIIEESTDRF